jgi:hypothetical protein
VCGQKAVLSYQTIWPLTVSCRLVFPGTTGPQFPLEATRRPPDQGWLAGWGVKRIVHGEA